MEPAQDARRPLHFCKILILAYFPGAAATVGSGFPLWEIWRVLVLRPCELQAHPRSL